MLGGCCRIRSSIIFTANLIELISRGTSGWSRALVALEPAVSSAEVKAEKALMRT